MKHMNKITKQNLITYLMVIIIYVVAQVMVSTGSMTSLMKGLLVPICAYIILAISLNLTVGFLGELSLGHAGFMCVGAFSSAIFTKCMQEAIPDDLPRFLIAIIVGAIAAGICGIMIGIPVLRLKGDYLAIVTLAFGEIIKNLLNSIYLAKDAKGFHISMKDASALQLDETGEMIINGPLGITGTPRNATFTIGIVLVLITLFVIMNLVHSRSGRAIMSIRDNRIAAESVGLDITKYKLMAFSISAGFAGIAGALYAHNLSSLTASSKNFGYNMSIMILVFVVLGGIGNIRGSIISAILLTVLPELLRGLESFRMLIYAIVLIVVMIFNWSPQVLTWREAHSLKSMIRGKEDAKEVL